MVLDELKNIIKNVFAEYKVGRQNPNLYEPVHYMLALGGKRVRPLLVLIAGQMFTDDIEQIIPAAKCIEIFHNFTLIHDDIMDNAPMRRGKASVFKKWDTNTAILSGDAMLILALKELENIKTNQIEIIKLFNETALLVCEGQQLDMEFEKKQSVSIESYLNMIALKTAVLLAASLKMGALSADADNQSAELLYECGYNLGIAFQLKDDLLDVFSEEKDFGKQQGGDILSAKKTYLYLKSLELLNENKKNGFIQLYHSNEESKVQKVKQIFEELNIQKYTEELIENYFNLGISALEQVNCSEQQKAPFFDLIEQLTDRKE